MQLKSASRTQVVLAAVAITVLAVVLYRLLLSQAPGTVITEKATGKALSPDGIPRIALSRLDEERNASTAGQRDIFVFAPSKVQLAQAASAAEAAAAAASAVPTPVPEPTPTPLPVVSLKFIGSADNGKGVKVAVLLTERNEVLTGRVGDVVANRYRVTSIGFESVDLEDVLGGGSRRLPLKGSS